MAIQDRITQIALAKQVAQNSAAASGEYHIGVNSGAVAALEITEDDLPTTWASRLLEGHDRSMVVPRANFETMGMPKTIGLLLAAALGDETFQAGPPHTHTFKTGDTLPYLTVFARRDAEYYKLSDLRIDELEIAWENTKAITVNVTSMGCKYEFLAAPYAGGTDERPGSGVLRGAGGTFKVNGSSVTVKSGSIKISNGLAAVHGSADVQPEDVFPAMQRVEVSLTIVPANLAEFRRVATGTTNGTALSGDPLYGSCELMFKNGTNTLTFNGNNVRFLCEFPETNAEGGPVELALEGAIANDPTGSDPFSFVLENDVASAY